METLPKAYMKVAKQITGYWGTYLPSMEMEPGALGRVLDGRFVREGHLNQLKGFDPKIHAIREEAQRDPITFWNTQHVTRSVIGLDASLPAGGGSAGIRMQFGGANEAAIICSGNAYRSFANLRAVKDLMQDLLEKQQWDRDYCMVTEVLFTRKAWICFSTAKNQTAEIHTSVPLVPGADPLGVLQAAGGQATLAASIASSQQAGYSTTLDNGGTPLFLAIRFRRDWLPPFHLKADYVKGAGAEQFEDPAFGD